MLLAALTAPGGAVARETETRLLPWSGGTPPGVALDTLAGDRIDLASLHGRPVLLHFFATWCEPCRDELSGLRDFALRNDHLTVLAVDVGEVDLRVRRFVTAIGWTAPVLLDRDRAVARGFGVAALPTTIALDAALRPRLVAEGDLDWRDPVVTEPIVALATKTPDRRTPACNDATC
ncbi:TlpA family protein disulfide reductase [Rhodoplanes roseus]|uniref:TlpA family protein disulfide reductase n=1 Tax=Rhodoplanes roseus TaxID=29409 RepID=UPI001472E5D4|nr:TlpA disulfide reductase family protein [Rhodoplanes roseus]